MQALSERDSKALDALLATRPPELGTRLREMIRDVRPSALLRATRACTKPLRPGLVSRLLRGRAAAPLLSPLASKFGGIPYLESERGPGARYFLGQINFAEAAAALRAEGFPLPDGMPERGLLALDTDGGFHQVRTRWYRAPDIAKHRAAAAVESVGKYEAGIGFEGGWTSRGLDWFDAVPEGDGELWDFWNDLEPAGVEPDIGDRHRLFGHTDEALNDHYGFAPAPGRSDSIRDYRLVWRVSYDNQADFAWGTNWIYAIIHEDDLAAGAFENVVVTAANA